MLKRATVRLAIECLACGTHLVLAPGTLEATAARKASGILQKIPERCPSCAKDWQDIGTAVNALGNILKNPQLYHVALGFCVVESQAEDDEGGLKRAV